jgi:hypothetical protein
MALTKQDKDFFENQIKSYIKAKKRFPTFENLADFNKDNEAGQLLKSLL